MELTTLCYIEKDNKYLMLNRTKKENDINTGKWIGVGGHFEKGETPNECIIREVYEETGLTLKKFYLRGILTFIADKDFVEYIWLYTASEFEGELQECNEGELAWIDKDKVMELNLWEGDKVFLRLLNERKEFFSLKLEYEGDRLINVKLE
ncbi:MAG: 8-oxo-dGTP diphosphatase [Clostridia bacterium]|nr:8-oxo-dGTP diphosphatase [Clostridia bacterium]